MSDATHNPHPIESELHSPWQLGYDESHLDSGMTYDDDPNSPRSVAYDEGRNAGESDRALREHGGRGYASEA